MSTNTGFIELDRAVDAIQIGHRHRTDLGDIDALATSIRDHGLLQPPTVTPEGVLVCGARRMAAIHQLGWRHVNVWVRSGISTTLGHLLAEQDDNVLHKPLTQIEAAALYRELKALMAEDAQQRAARTHFSGEHQPRWNGSGKFPDPLDTPVGDSREQAAQMISGASSYKTLDKINYMQTATTDEKLPANVRTDIAEDLAQIEKGAPVHPAYERARSSVETAYAARAETLDELAQQALTRAKAGRAANNKATSPRPVQDHGDEASAQRWSVRAFIHTWTELDSWWTHYDPSELARELTDEQITAFLFTAEGTKCFADELQATTGTSAEGNASEFGSNSGDEGQRHLRAL